MQTPAYIKPSIFLGIIFGLILGILLTIPIIQLFVIFVFLGIGAFVALLLKQNKFLEKFEQKDGIIIGGVAGFVSVIGATISFLSIVFIAELFFSGAFAMIKSFFSSISSFIVLCIFIFCLAFMNMLFNMGSALLVVSLSKKEDVAEKPQFKLEN